MKELLRELQEMIAQDGPISLERYMRSGALHPCYGYYMTREPFGAAGDFVTAPEISQMFGELIGLWAVEIWRMGGAPAPMRLVELGPGRGTLMADALRVIRNAANESDRGASRRDESASHGDTKSYTHELSGACSLASEHGRHSTRRSHLHCQ